MDAQIRTYFEMTYCGLKLVTQPPNSDPEGKEIDHLCVEWRYLAKHLTDALGNQGAANVLETSPLDKSMAFCKLNFKSQELADFLARELQTPRGDTDHPSSSSPFFRLLYGRRIRSGIHSNIPTFKKKSEDIQASLKLLLFAHHMGSLSGVIDAIDELRDQPPRVWAVAAQHAQLRRAHERHDHALAKNRLETGNGGTVS